MYSKIIFSFVIFLILNSCGSHPKNEELKLNNGEKWKVIESMIVYIRNMETDLSLFEKSAQKDYKILVGKLEKNIDLLTSNCTMKGKAHDELHKWLLPNIALIKKLSKEKNNQESAEIFNEIQSSFETFNEFFQ